MMCLRSALLAVLLAVPAVAVAQSGGDTVEAGRRFTAGVALYNEADYTAALVEFQRAYQIAPHFTVLYNIGQTHFQLQDYAAAYTVLSQYLREAPANAEHRKEVTATVEQLKGRIGKLDVTTSEPGAEVTIDDVVIGKTPLAAPVLVSIGRRMVSVSAPGKVTQTRLIDVAAGDTVRQEVVLAGALAGGAEAATVQRSTRQRLAPAAWLTTGVLAAGAITFGVLAWRASGDLDDLRGDYPVTREALDEQADRLALFSNLADGLAIASVAVGTVALVLSLSARRASPREQRTQVGVGPRGLVIGGSF